MLYRRFGKRLFDVVVAISVGLFLLPIVVLVAVLVAWRLGTPVLFCQRRPGLNGNVFLMYKFRTMTDERDDKGELMPDAVRLTPFGRFLRSSSLDELPGLWNVIRGEMSLVGPRPLLVQYLERYSPEQARRHQVRPGITGWAQVNGRNAISWEDKFTRDVWYVDRVSAWLDFKILVMTVAKVFARSDISAKGDATMPEFEGAKRPEKLEAEN